MISQGQIVYILFIIVTTPIVGFIAAFMSKRYNVENTTFVVRFSIQLYVITVVVAYLLLKI